MATKGFPQDDEKRRERRDLLIFLLLLLLGFACLLATAQIAIRPERTWQVSADMLSKLNPDEGHAAPEIYIEPLRPEALTPLPWDEDLILTPMGTPLAVPTLIVGQTPASTATPQEAAVVPTPSPSEAAPTSLPTSTPPVPTLAPLPTASPTSTRRPISTATPTLITPSSTPTPPLPSPPSTTNTPPPSLPTDTPTPPPPTSTPPPPTRTHTPTPGPTSTHTPTPTRTHTPTPGPTSTHTPTPTRTHTPTPGPTSTYTPTPTPTSTSTPTATPTPTDTATPTPTSTNTPTPDPPPNPPANLRAAAGNGQITLGWDANSEPDLAGYRVYSSTTGVFAFHAATLGAYYLDLPLVNGTVYSYYVTAFDTGGHESGISNIASAQPYDITPYTTTTNVSCIGVPDCTDAGGPPDGNEASVDPGDSLVLDFGAGYGIIDGPGPDFVFYEWPNAPGILLDLVTIAVSADGTTWYTVFNWDGVPGGVAGTNVDGYADDTDPDNVCAGECDNEPIQSSDLYPGGLPFNTGITIDIGPWAPPGYSYRFVRFTCPAGGGDAAQVDGVRRLN